MSPPEIAPAPDMPRAIGPYSQWIRADQLIFLAGQIGVNPATGKIADGGAGAQTEQLLKNMTAVLREAGASLRDVVKMIVFLRDMADYQEVNGVYQRYFDRPYPARTAVAVTALPLGVVVEMDATAAVPAPSGGRTE